MKMTNFVNKWAKKAIKEYTDYNNLNTLENEHFCIAFDQATVMIEEMEKVELSSKYSDLGNEEIKELLIEKIQEKIDSLIDC